MQIKELLSFGNTKLPKDTAIFNMCSATDCPSLKLGLCKVRDKCYALKAERLYKQVLPYRRRQEEFWDGTTADEFAYQLLKVNEDKKLKLKLLRVSEAGDFKTQEDVDKLSSVADILISEGSDIGVYAYTARTDLNFSNRGVLQVIGSYFMVDAMFVPVKKPESLTLPNKSYICKADCSVCSVCSYGQQSTIFAKIH